jgi:hypothetical protein
MANDIEASLQVLISHLDVHHHVFVPKTPQSITGVDVTIRTIFWVNIFMWYEEMIQLQLFSS